MARHSGTPFIRIQVRTCGYLAILLIGTLLTSGCMADHCSIDGGPAPVNVVTAPAGPGPAPALLPEATHGICVPVKNITITHPKNLDLYTGSGLPGAVVRSVDVFSDTQTADSINGYLRWDSVRARTHPAEAARIMGLVKDLDGAISATTLSEDLVLYRGISSGESLQITNTTRYEDDRFISSSFDPSIIYHDHSKDGRDRNDGYVTMLVLMQKPGAHLLYLNETNREILLPRATVWELTAEEKIEKVAFSLDSIPRYHDEELKNVRLLYLSQIS